MGLGWPWVLRHLLLLTALYLVRKWYGVGWCAMGFVALNQMGLVAIFPLLYAIYTSPAGYYIKVPPSTPHTQPHREREVSRSTDRLI